MRFLAMEFDFGTKWGVAIEDGNRRHAIRIPHEGLTKEQAIEAAKPELMCWLQTSSTSR